MYNHHHIAVLLAGIDTIPTLPAIVGQVTQTITDPQRSARDLMEIIYPDQALTLKILKAANAAFYGRVRETGTLEQALVILGFSQVRNLVMSTALFNNFQRLDVTPLFSMRKFWEHSFVCGLAARIIAKEMKLSDGELYVAGLLHDIGKLAICMVLPKEFSTIVTMAGTGNLKTAPAELDILGITHAEVGLRLAKRWMLPHNLVAAVGYHHRPASAPSHQAYPLVVHMADLLAHNATAKKTLNDHPSADGLLFTPDICDLALSAGLIIHPDTIQKFKTELDVQIDAQAGMLDIMLARRSQPRH
jgi:putative nucleotidyltransferase with HDIG domain